MIVRIKGQSEIQPISVDKIDRPDVIDRIDIDMLEVEGLSKNIQEQGLLQPPILRPKAGRFEIIVGDRRIMAIKMLGWEEVGCGIVEIDDQTAAEIRASENLQRENLTVMEEAKIYKNLHHKHGVTLDNIAKKMGKTTATVKRRLDLLKMPMCLQNAMQAKSIGYGVAEALWSITDESALEYYLGFAMDHGATVAIARDWVNDWKNSQRRIMQEKLDPVEALASPAIRPTYLACDICQEPELIQDMQMLRICRKCIRKIAGVG